MKRVTIKDVANAAGVSVTLVSFVLNAKVGKDGKLDCPVNQNTAKRVLDVANKMGYRKNVAAASLRSGRSHSIAVIPTDISNKFFAEISRKIEDKAYEYGYTVLFGSSDEDVNKLDSVLNTVMAYNIDGVILAPVKNCEDSVRKLVEANIPVVLLDRDLRGVDGVGKVLLDDFQAGSIATEELLKSGCRKIEMISYNLEISSLLERERGYKQKMIDNGLANNIKINYTTYESVEEDVKSIIAEARKRGADAFFLPTYSLSAQVMSVMKDLGLGTPEDFAIVGFDKSNIYKLFATTVAHIIQPLSELGETTVELIHDMIEGKRGPETIVLKPTLVPGGSAQKKN